MQFGLPAPHHSKSGTWLFDGNDQFEVLRHAYLLVGPLPQ